MLGADRPLASREKWKGREIGSVGLWLAIGAVFAPFGGLMAGIITYQEYRKHRLEPGRACGEAARAALFAFLVLLGIMAACGWLLS